MTKVNNIESIIAIEKARSVDYGYDFDENDERIFAEQLTALFDEYGLSANNLLGVYLFDDEDITDSEYLMIRIGEKFIVVHLEWIADIVAFMVLDD